MSEQKSSGILSGGFRSFMIPAGNESSAMLCGIGFVFYMLLRIKSLEIVHNMEKFRKHNFKISLEKGFMPWSYLPALKKI